MPSRRAKSVIGRVESILYCIGNDNMTLTHAMASINNNIVNQPNTLTCALALLWSRRVRAVKFSLGMDGAKCEQIMALVLAGLPTTTTCVYIYQWQRLGLIYACFL